MSKRDVDEGDMTEHRLSPLKKPMKSNKTLIKGVVITREQAKLYDEIAEFRKLNSQLFEHVKTTFRLGQRMGELLARFKKIAGHGNWLPWLQENLPDVSERSAQVYLSLCENRDFLAKYAAAADLTLRDACRLLGNGGKPKRVRERATKAAQPQEGQEHPDGDENHGQTNKRDQEQKTQAHKGTEQQSGQAEEKQKISSHADTVALEANILDNLRFAITEAAGHIATNKRLNLQVRDTLVGSIVQMYLPEVVAGEFLSALRVEEYPPGQLYSLYSHIRSVLDDWYPTEDAEVRPEGVTPSPGERFVPVPEAIEACRAALSKLGKDFEEPANSIPNSMKLNLEGLDLPRTAYVLVPPILSIGSRFDRLVRLREVLKCVARALPERDDTRAKIDKAADALDGVEQ